MARINYDMLIHELENVRNVLFQPSYRNLRTSQGHRQPRTL